MMKKHVWQWSVAVASGLILLVLALATTSTGARAAIPQVTVTLPEGNDFATRVLRDPWDMSEFTDISQYLNTSGQQNNLQNIQVQNGIFSATSDNDAQFFPLFPGYLTAVKSGKVGALYPIAAGTYKCLYFAMNVQASEFAQVFWFADDRMNGSGGIWGQSDSIPLSPSIWKLYAVNLSTYPSTFGTTWSAAPNGQWQGLRFDPANQSGVNFSVDWMRLTDCSAINTTVTWSPNGSYNAIWVRSLATNNDILVATGLNGSDGSYTLDTQGLASGSYQICMGNTSSCLSVLSNTLVVNQAPIATFTRPSFTSGTDYATQAGNAWDFNDASNVTSFARTSVSFANGLMNVITPSGQLPDGADPVIYLNTPQSITNASAYRYLSYRLNTQYPIQNVPNGMIVRWIWGIPGGCDLVSNQIAYDVGWQTYSVDLSDPYNGQVIQKGGNCPGGTPTSWSTTPTVVKIRFKPNENALGQDLSQQVDWVRLTQVDQVSHGTLFPIQISLNKSLSGVKFTFYYTDDLRNPTQQRVVLHQNPVPNPTGPYNLYLPFVLRDLTAGTTSGPGYMWDTTAVAPGQYYVCVVADDGTNSATYCSDAPVNVS